MRSVPKRGSVGLLHELSRQFQADPTLPRSGTDFIATRLSDFASASKAYRTLVPTKLNSDPAANQNRRTERSDGSFTDLVTLIENVLNRCEDFQALT
jgi:hypothetical protein